MAASIVRERIEMRVDNETKRMAERAAAALGCSSLTEFITRLIRDNAPEIIQHETTMTLSNDQFDHFIAACDDKTLKPSETLITAVKRLDKEGY